MKRKAFTLLELLLVIAIMGFMGTVAVGGYRAMRRGMEERSVMQNVSQFIRSAYQRAQIDRQPVNVYFWNETLSEEEVDKPLQVVGHAVAVRRSGRITMVKDPYLVDEFGDLRFSRLTQDEDSQSGQDDSTSGDSAGVFLYAINGNESGSQMYRSTVSETTKKLPSPPREPLLQGGVDRPFEAYAYVLKDKNGVQWRPGMAYGFEFADLQLPHNYLFGANYSRSVKSPISGQDVIRFNVSANSGSGATQGLTDAGTVTVYSLRPGASGSLSAQRVGTSERPNQNLNN